MSKQNKIKISFDQLTEIMRFNPTLKEVSEFFKVSEDTIERRIKEQEECTFAEFRHKSQGKVRIDLIRKALNMAMEGNTKMLIFL